MKILVIGGGGREHAVVWKLHQEGHELYCAPGNAGISQIAKCVPISATNVEEIVQYASEEKFDLVVVTPDDPLALGMVDVLREKGIKAFGPTKAAAVIESSKAFAKNLMQKYGIPTASFKVFQDANDALKYLKTQTPPLVIKADGLALGKGVYICATRQEAENAVKEIMIDRKFGQSGAKVVIEEYMTGPEVSLLCFCDGENFSLMPAAQDHKRVFDCDKGPNTGGMGAFAPSPKFTEEIKLQCIEKIVKPTISAMKKEGRPFCGVLYFGLMLTESGPVVIEYNSRFGDPETQVILPLLKTGLADIMLWCIDGTLKGKTVEWHDGAAACVVMASGGYPGTYEKNHKIYGIQNAEKKGAVIFHAGTAKHGDGFATAGGRVLGVTAVADTLNNAILKAYEAVGEISFKGMHYRKDIGKK